METQSRPKKDNILIIAYNDLNNSGVPNVIYQVIKSQHDKYHFDIVTFGNGDYFYKRLLSEGIKDIEIINFNIKKPKSKFCRILFYLFIEQKTQFKETSKLLRDKKYLAIHSFKEYDSAPFLKAAKKNNVKIRIIHSNVIHSSSENILSKFRKKSAIKYATKLVGVNDLCAKKAFGNKKYQIIYSSYDERKFNMKNENNTYSDTLSLVQIGSLSNNKNQKFSLGVLINLKKITKNVHLKIIGSEKEPGYLFGLKDLISKHNISENVSIIGSVKNPTIYLSNSTYALLPSKQEGASLVAVEAQACGIKVFASSTISQEMNLGGIIYLDLKSGPELWAKEIYNFWKKDKGKRDVYDMTRFSKKIFKEKIDNLYK